MFEDQRSTIVTPCLFFNDDYPTDKEFTFKSVIAEQGEPKTSLNRQVILEKNRQAALRCRQKKKQWTENLKERTGKAEERNKELLRTVSDLKEEALFLRNLLLTHNNCNCNMVQIYIRRASEKLANGITTTTGPMSIKGNSYSHSRS